MIKLTIFLHNKHGRNNDSWNISYDNMCESCGFTTTDLIIDDIIKSFDDKPKRNIKELCVEPSVDQLNNIADIFTAMMQTLNVNNNKRE